MGRIGRLRRRCSNFCRLRRFMKTWRRERTLLQTAPEHSPKFDYDREYLAKISSNNLDPLRIEPLRRWHTGTYAASATERDNALPTKTDLRPNISLMRK